MAILVGEVPVIMTCPQCKTQICTLIRHKFKNKAHVIAIVLCLIGCWPCCLIPYCMVDSCMVTYHYCPACGAFLGTHSY